MINDRLIVALSARSLLYNFLAFSSSRVRGQAEPQEGGGFVGAGNRRLRSQSGTSLVFNFECSATSGGQRQMRMQMEPSERMQIAPNDCAH